jgi:hypothetical protein
MRIARTLIIALALLVLGAGGARASLADFARCITRTGARFYGTSWCPHCASQRRMFGTAFRDIAYVECSVNGSDQTTAECEQAGVTSYPTWEFRDGSRAMGELSLEQLASRTGCKYDRGTQPQIHDVPDGRGGAVKLPGAEGVEIIDIQ